MSKLAQQFRRIRFGGAQVGFTSAPSAPDRALLLVASLPRCAPELVAAAAERGADAIMFPANAGAPLREAVRAAGGRAVGARFQGAVGPDALAPCREAGCDFAVFDLHAEAAILAERQLGLVAGVASSWEDSLLRALGELPLDALEGEPINAGSPPLRIRDLLRLRRMLALAGRPLMVPAERDLSRAELEALTRGGVDAVALAPGLLGDSAAAVGGAVAQWRAAIDALPARELRRRRERAAATLPVAGLRRAEVEDEEDEDGGDE
ncbi:MAG: hypothetical protein HY691_17480 [Chloroflexi bacterium]|nr:hypothetical protein [Chloroflexota bacterium]